jgi:hypothetical protein
MERLCRSWLSGLVAVLLAAGLAQATVLVPLELGQLSRDAGAIVRGRVVNVEARWTDDRRGVETLVTLEVERYLKGELGETVTFRVPGGRIGRFRSIVVGAPEFDRDQRVIVFLGHRGPSVPHVVGFNQGVYRMAQTGGTVTVTPPPLIGVAAARVVRGDRRRRPLPLAAFEQQVQTLSQSAGAR